MMGVLDQERTVSGYGRWCPYRFGCFLFCGPGLQLDFKNPARADPVSCPWSGYQREPLLGKGAGNPSPDGLDSLFWGAWGAGAVPADLVREYPYDSVCHEAGLSGGLPEARNPTGEGRNMGWSDLLPEHVRVSAVSPGREFEGCQSAGYKSSRGYSHGLYKYHFTCQKLRTP